MRGSAADKEASYQRIVRSASRLFRERGLHSASVQDVMKDAGLTHGGFYKHFEHKDALVEQAMAAAIDDLARQLDAPEPAENYALFRQRYLSLGHRDRPGEGCPVAAYAQDVGRGPERLTTVMGQGVRRISDLIARAMKGTPRVRREAALREFSLLVGALVIARASDPQTAAEVLAACQTKPGDDHA